MNVVDLALNMFVVFGVIVMAIGFVCLGVIMLKSTFNLFIKNMEE